MKSVGESYLPSYDELLNWIIGYCNSRAVTGLAIMIYEPLYYALPIWYLYGSAQIKNKLRKGCLYKYSREEFSISCVRF